MDPNTQRIQALKLETSMFNLTKICFNKCTEDQSFYKISSMATPERKEVYSDFETCLKNCTVALIQTKDYVKIKFLQDMDQVRRANEEIYKDFYR